MQSLGRADNVMRQRKVERRTSAREINSNTNGYSQGRHVTEILFSDKDSAECMGSLWLEKKQAGEEEKMRYRGKNGVP